jgi:hypothetical protein
MSYLIIIFSSLRIHSFLILRYISQMLVNVKLHTTFFSIT